MFSLKNSNLSLNCKVVYALLIKIINILLFINQITINFNNFNLINGFLILIFAIIELNGLDDMNVKKDLIIMILEVLSLLYVTYQFVIHQFLQTLILGVMYL